MGIKYGLGGVRTMDIKLMRIKMRRREFMGLMGVVGLVGFGFKLPAKKKSDITVEYKGKKIGKMQRVTINEKRAPLEISGEGGRIMFLAGEINKIFAGGIYNYRSQKMPFDIVIEGGIRTKIENVWMADDNNVYYISPNFIIIDNIKFSAESITNDVIS